MRNIFDRNKLRGDSLEIKVSNKPIGCSGGIDHVTDFSIGKEKIGNCCTHLSYDDSRSFDSKEHFDNLIRDVENELKSYGFTVSISKDYSIIKVKRYRH